MSLSKLSSCSLHAVYWFFFEWRSTVFHLSVFKCDMWLYLFVFNEVLMFSSSFHVGKLIWQKIKTSPFVTQANKLCNSASSRFSDITYLTVSIYDEENSNPWRKFQPMSQSAVCKLDIVLIGIESEFEVLLITSSLYSPKHESHVTHGSPPPSSLAAPPLFLWNITPAFVSILYLVNSNSLLCGFVMSLIWCTGCRERSAMNTHS